MTFLELTRHQISGTSIFSRGYFNELSRQDRLWTIPLIIAGLGAGIAVFEYFIIQNYRGMLYLGEQTGREELLFFFAFLASTIFIFILSVPAALSRIFLAGDSPLLLSLPISPTAIVLSKTLLLYGIFLPLHLALYIPALILYLAGHSPNTGFIIAAVLQGVIPPLFPLALGTIFSSFLAGVVGRIRNRVVFETAGMFLITGVLVIFQITVSRQMMTGFSMEADTGSTLLRLVTASLNLFPPLAWTARSLTEGYGFLAFSLILPAAFFSAYLLILSRRITWILQRRQETSRPRESKKRRIPGVRTRSRMHALLWKEWSVLLSESVFLFEVIGEVLALPLVLVILSFAVPADIIALVAVYPGRLGITGLLVFALVLFFSGINSISATSLSREGRLFDLSMSLPVSGRDHVKGKLLFHLLLFLPGLVIDLTILCLLLDVPLPALSYLIPGSLAAMVFNAAMTLNIDIKHPFLTWTHPQQAMKQNMNTLTGLGFSLLSISAVCGIGVGLYLAGLPEPVIGFVILGVFLAAAGPMMKRLFMNAERRYVGG